MRTLRELLDADDPAWPLVQRWIAEACHPVRVLPAHRPQAEAALLGLQVSTHSALGAIVYETGGIFIDDGWLRLLGSGGSEMRASLPEWNGLSAGSRPALAPGALMVAWDVVGGAFAINGGAWKSGATGDVWYFAPDNIAWEDTNLSYSQFVGWSLGGDLEQFYANVRWPGWRDEISALGGDRAILIWPPLWAEGAPVIERERQATPIRELLAMEWDIAGQLTRRQDS